jgi:hypothetical protein
LASENTCSIPVVVSFYILPFTGILDIRILYPGDVPTPILLQQPAPTTTGVSALLTGYYLYGFPAPPVPPPVTPTLSPTLTVCSYLFAVQEPATQLGIIT